MKRLHKELLPVAKGGGKGISSFTCKTVGAGLCSHKIEMINLRDDLLDVELFSIEEKLTSGQKTVKEQ